MDWRCGSGSRASALQAQSPEFKPNPKKEKEKEIGGTTLLIKMLRGLRVCVFFCNDVD
jgi:hypothetical protein